MTTLLDHAIDAAKRLPPTGKTPAKTLFALVENEAQPPVQYSLAGGEPAEDEIVAPMPTIMPSALPTKAEAAAWNRLSEEEQVRRYREALNRPGSSEAVDDSLQDIYARVLQHHGL